LSPTQLWFRGVSTPSSIEQPSLSVFKEALPPTWETPLEEGWRSHALQASIDPGFEAKGDETLSIGDANDFCKLIDSLPRFRHELPTPTAHPDCEFHDRWPDHTASASAVVVAAAVSDETILPLDMFGSDPQQGHGELLIMTLELKLQPLLSTRLASPEPSDGRIDRIIESARLQMMADPDRMGPISIAGILGDDPNNILLRDVKRMLNPIRRARHMSTYLGICTVLYHLLHVNTPIHPSLFFLSPLPTVLSSSFCPCLTWGYLAETRGIETKNQTVAHYAKPRFSEKGPYMVTSDAETGRVGPFGMHRFPRLVR
jgi:hypothetical protein